MLLHVSCIGLSIAAVFAKGKGNTGDLKVLLADVPDGLRWLVYAISGYAFVSFWVYWLQSVAAAEHQRPASDARGFSGIWMMFFATSFAIFYTLATKQGSSEPASSEPAPPK
jgi:hypothetical protein